MPACLDTDAPAGDASDWAPDLGSQPGVEAVDFTCFHGKMPPGTNEPWCNPKDRAASLSADGTVRVCVYDFVPFDPSGNYGTLPPADPCRPGGSYGR
jgi:hypothetical protein